MIKFEDNLDLFFHNKINYKKEKSHEMQKLANFKNLKDKFKMNLI